MPSAPVAREVELPAGYSIAWAGQLEYATCDERFRLVVPLTLAIIFVLLFRLSQVARLPSIGFSSARARWWRLANVLLGYDLSVATAVGFIALGGVAAEFGVVMLLYLDHADERREAEGRFIENTDAISAIEEGAVLRVRPKAMTVAVIIAGLLPIFWGRARAQSHARIAAPMVGGMITAPLLSMLVIPAAYLLILRRRLVRPEQEESLRPGGTTADGT